MRGLGLGFGIDWGLGLEGKSLGWDSDIIR